MTNSNWNIFDMETISKNFNVENWTESQKKTLESSRAVNESLVGSLKKVMQRQSEMFQSAVQDNVEAARAMSQARGVEELMNYQNEYTRRTLETATKNATELSEILRDCSKECSDICQKLAKENMDSFQAAAKPAKTTKAAASK